MSGDIEKRIHRKLVKSFMDILILMDLKDSPMSGYDFIYNIRRRFNILMSSGTVYYLLYAMERDGLIRGRLEHRKRVYTLTDKGEENLKIILKARGRILGLTTKLFGS